MRKFGLLFLMLGLPVVIYLAYVNLAENRYQSLPIWGPKKLLPTALNNGTSHPDDTLYANLPALDKWMDRRSNTVLVLHLVRYDEVSSSRALRDAQAARIADVFRNNPLVQQYTLGLDDYPANIPDSARPFRTPVPMEQVLDAAHKARLWQDLRVYAPDWQKQFKQIPQEGLTLLIDRKRRVRGFYRGVLKDHTDRLMEDTRTLIAEYANTPNRRRRRL
jgi:protein SCO1/2